MVWLNIVGLFVQYTRPEGALARGRGDVQSCNWGWRGARQGKNLQINNNIECGITTEKLRIIMYAAITVLVRV